MIINNKTHTRHVEVVEATADCVFFVAAAVVVATRTYSI